MKKLLAFILAMVMLLSLAACNSSSNPNDDSDNNTEAPAGSDTTDNNDSSDTNNSSNSNGGDEVNSGDSGDNGNNTNKPNNSNPNPAEIAKEGIFTFTLNADRSSYTVSVFSEAILEQYESDEKLKEDYAEVFNTKEITIPSSYDGVPVTIIGDYSFYNCNNLTTVNIPDSIIKIGNYAFSECWELSSAKIPSEVTFIGDYAFSYCSLDNITIPDGTTHIGVAAFWRTTYYLDDNNWENEVLYIDNHLIEAKNTLTGTYKIKDGTKTIAGLAFSFCGNMTSVSIPASVITIGERAFNYCAGLTSVNIPDGVNTIGRQAFVNCTGIDEIAISDAVENIGRYAFSDTAYYKNEQNWDADVLYIGNHLIEAKNTISGSYEIRGNTKTIANGAFAACKKMTHVTIPDTITHISEDAFYKCENLIAVSLPATIVSIGDYAFYHCFDLKNIEIPQNVTYIGSNAFWHCESLTTVNIPAVTSFIDLSAFSGCIRLTSFNVDSNNVKYLSIDGSLYNKSATMLIQYALGKTESTFAIPTGVTHINKYAFSYALKLTEIQLPIGVTHIGDCAFSYCTSLKTINIPDSVISIGEDIFIYSDRIDNIYFENPNNLETDFDYN